MMTEGFSIKALFTVADNSGQFVLTPLEQSATSGNYDVARLSSHTTTGFRYIATHSRYAS